MLIESFRRQDPSPVPQLAVPISVTEYMFETAFLAKVSHVQIATDLLAVKAFYYMLRVGEYTLSVEHNKNSTRTVQFTVNDITF